MGLSIRLLATRDDTPLDVFGTAKLDGSRYFLRVRDGQRIGPFAGGTDLGVVQRGKLLGSTIVDIVAFNHDDELHVLQLAYVTSFKPLPVPPVVDTTPYDQEDLNARIAPLETKISDLTLQLETASEVATDAEKKRLRDLLGL
jgi:hypothetical protein